MPLAIPQNSKISELLEEAGVEIEKSPLSLVGPRRPIDVSTLKGQLENAGLGRENIFEILREVLSDPNTSNSVKVRAMETVLKMDGALKETPVAVIPQFTIVINDPSGSGGPNPILFPRESAA